MGTAPFPHRNQRSVGVMECWSAGENKRSVGVLEYWDPESHHSITPFLSPLLHSRSSCNPRSAMLEALVRAVAEGFGLGVFAGAPGDGLFLLDFGLEGRKPGALVRAVAQRLGFGTSAGAPPIGARLGRLDNGKLLKNDWFAHRRTCKHKPPRAQTKMWRQKTFGCRTRIFSFPVGQSCRSALNSWAAQQRRPTDDVKIFVMRPGTSKGKRIIGSCLRVLANAGQSFSA